MSQTDDILSRVTGIFREELKQPNLVVLPSTTANDVEGWDSLTHMALIHMVELEFKLKFKLPEILKFKNVGDMCQAIEKRLSG